MKILRLVTPGAELNITRAYETPKAPARAVDRRRILIALVASRLRSERRFQAIGMRRTGRMIQELSS